PDPARRAGGRALPDRDRDAGSAAHHLAAAGRPGHRAGRAPHGAGDGDLRPDQRAGLRPRHRARQSGRGAREPGGNRGLPGRAGMSTLTVSGLRVAYGAATVLHDVSLEVRAGEIVSVVGGNGAGKTTLLKTVAGVLRPAGGATPGGGRGARG